MENGGGLSCTIYIDAPHVVPLTCRHDNIYIFLGNVSPHLREVLRVALSALLHFIYGIRRKWEPPGDRYVWPERSFAPEGGKLSLVRKGISVGSSLDYVEWERWVDIASRHARLLWSSQFPSILQKNVWYAFTGDDV